MKVIAVVTLVVSVSAILSCSDGVPTLGPATGNATEAISVIDANNSTITPAANVTSTGLNPAHGLPGHRCDIAVGQPLNSKPAIQPSTVNNSVTIATSPNTKPSAAPFVTPGVKTVSNPATNFISTTQSIAGLNPPHGRPGHRCDIKVGEPLNSNPSTTTTTPITTTTSPAIAPTTNTTAVAPGLNPKHGQPGHRCDIMVGQPLNSKPALPANTTPTTTPITTTTSPSITPTTNTTAVAPGMNPKHGQPGHRCDIPVGQPLNSKPAQTSLQTTPITPWK